MNLALIDTHCHLDLPDYDRDRDAVFRRAFDAGVEHLLLVGLGPTGTRRALATAEPFEAVFVSTGLHPHDAAEFSDALLAELRELAGHEKVIAIGECGLDYYRDRSPRDAQQRAFRAQLELARDLELPFILHCRDGQHAGEKDRQRPNADRTADAYADAARLIAEVFWDGKPPLAAGRIHAPAGRGPSRPIGVAHCFSGTPTQAQAFVRLGMYLSVAGHVTYKKSAVLQEAVRAARIERLVLETDAPWLTPVPRRGQRNESAFVAHTLAKVAELKAPLTPDDVARITTRNAIDLFGFGRRAARPRTIVYPIRRALYVNLTNRCDAHCVFCPRASQPVVKGHWLGLDETEEPSAAEVLAAISAAGGASAWDEIVFCGYGEPTLCLDVLIEVARAVKSAGGRTRLNTDGHGSLIHARDITVDLAGAIDVVSVSLNAQTQALYDKIMRNSVAGDNYQAMQEFTKACVSRGLQVVMTALEGFPGVDMAACAKIATEELGAEFRWREYQDLG